MKPYSQKDTLISIVPNSQKTGNSPNAIIRRSIDKPIDKTVFFVKENLEYFSNLNSDGKLVRGCLVNLGYYLLKDNREYSNDLALAYEVFQCPVKQFV